MTDLATTVAPWWASVKGRGKYVLAVVVGLRQSGKTTWFTELSADGSHGVVLWKVLGVARARSTDEVWKNLWDTLGIPPHANEDSPIEHLDLHLEEEFDHGLTLVVDDWDNAIDGRDTTVSDACYEVLDALARFCLDQARDRGRRVCLGLLLLTSLPDVVDLEYFARDVQRRTFERLSQLVTRSFATERFPLLDRAASEAVLIEQGLSRRNARRVANACGGWLWLLLEAADAVRRYEGWTPEAIAHVRDKRLPAMLGASLWDWLAARHEVRCEPIDYLARELARGRSPSSFGLPHSFDDPARAAPLIRQLLSRAFLVVDIENLRMPFQIHAADKPAAYPDGVEHFLRQHIAPWLRQLGEEHDVAAEDVWLVGRSRERIDATVGVQTLGQRHFLADGLREKVRRNGEKDNTDDTLLTSLVVQHAERHPLARFILVSSDLDAPLILGQLGTLDQVIVYAPWQASRKLRQHMPREGQLIENSFPVPRPPQDRRS